MKRTGWIKRKTKIRPSNPARQARRRKKYSKYLASATWKRKKRETHELDGWKCRKCPYVDETKTGLHLICNHTSYVRFGGQEIPGEDTETLCEWCDERQEAMKRPWNVGRLGK